MLELDIEKTVHCPAQDRDVSFEGECEFCGCHVDSDGHRGTVTCSFDEHPENLDKSREDVATEEEDGQ